MTRIVNLNNIHPKPFRLIADKNGEFEYTAGDTKFKFTYNVDDIADLIPSTFCKTVITEVDGSRSKEIIDHFIRYKFMAKDAKQFRLYLEKHVPALEKTAEFTGEDGSTFTAGFQIGSDLFWS